MRLVIVDDHVIFRESLRLLLESRGFEVVGESGDGEEAVAICAEMKPELVLMDLTLDGVSGIEAIRRLTSEQPDVRTVVLTASEQESDLFEALEAGAQGFIHKNIESGEFVQLLNKALDGEPALTPDLARRTLRALSHRGTTIDPDALTPRESDVLELMVDGVTTNRSLAERLGVSKNTVKFHVRNILDKLHVNDRTQAVAQALRQRLVTPRSGPASRR